MIFNPGDEYYSFIDEFMAAIKLRWPKALIQFEDFQSKHAATLLNRLAIVQIKQLNLLTISDTERST